MKANPDRFHPLLNDTDFQYAMRKLNFFSCEKLLGIKTDTKLKFEEHVETLSKNASQKINALGRI